MTEERFRECKKEALTTLDDMRTDLCDRINKTPTSEIRNRLTDLHIIVLNTANAIHSLRRADDELAKYRREVEWEPDDAPPPTLTSAD